MQKLPEQEIGHEVRNAPLRKNQTWKQATCVEKLSDRSYVVQSGNETIRRNRQFLRPAFEPATVEKQSNNVGTESRESCKEMLRVPELPAKPTDPEQSSEDGSLAQETKAALSASKKTRTRTIRPPSTFKDFI